MDWTCLQLEYSSKKNKDLFLPIGARCVTARAQVMLLYAPSMLPPLATLPCFKREIMYDPALKNAEHEDQHCSNQNRFQSRRERVPDIKIVRVCVRYYTDSDMSFIELDTDAQQYRVVIPRCKRLPPTPSIVHLLRLPRRGMPGTPMETVN